MENKTFNIIIIIFLICIYQVSKSENFYKIQENTIIDIDYDHPFS